VSTVNHTDNNHPVGPVELPPTDPGPVRRLAVIAALAGWVAFVVLTAINFTTAHGTGWQDFFLAYLSGWVFCLFLPFGAIGLLMIGYLTTASWQLVLRRSFQASARTLPWLAVLFLPIAVSLFINLPAHDATGSVAATHNASPYWWADPTWEGDVQAVAAAKGVRPEAVEENQHKIHDYLNRPFFLIRFVLYFAFWFGMVVLLNKWAGPAETRDDPTAKYNLHAVSGPGIILWAITGTFAVTDWVMSVEPTWASSMFPVVFGMNAFISAMSIGVLTFYALNADRPGVLAIVKDKFRIDIGTLLFGFTMVWAYASFAQYMLIWAGNLPEEITYYAKRGREGWEFLAYVLMAFHWFLPFIVFLFREVKTSPRAMRRMATLLLTVCALDAIWWIVPAIPRPEGGLHFPMAVAAAVGLGGLWGLAYAWQLGTRPLLPENSETTFLATWGHHGHADTPAGTH
jgi:hypothetical protein